MTTTLDIDRPAPPRRPRVNWTAVSVVIALALALLSWLGNGAQSYQSLSGRVSRLETQRENDASRMERIENKIDRLLERK
jgi:hypothetical protein